MPTKKNKLTNFVSDYKTGILLSIIAASAVVIAIQHSGIKDLKKFLEFHYLLDEYYGNID